MTLPPSPEVVASSERSLGQRLRDGRLARGLDIGQVAASLRAPNSLVEAIERDQFDSLGATIYARGYLTSYARLVGVQESAVERALADKPDAPVPLHPGTHVPHARYLLDRYARKGAYLVLTASIVLPVLWIKDHPRVQELGMRSLDVPADVAIDEATRATGDGSVLLAEQQASGSTAAPAAESADEDVTVAASLAPFRQSAPASREETDAAPVEPVPQEPMAGSGWRLSVSEDSWVEILSPDGVRLEYGLLPAGAEREFAPGAVGSVAVGNAAGVELARDGQPVDLAPFRRANVARFTVSSDGRLTPSGG